jgi:hypothetical protein
MGKIQIGQAGQQSNLGWNTASQFMMGKIQIGQAGQQSNLGWNTASCSGNKRGCRLWKIIGGRKAHPGKNELQI